MNPKSPPKNQQSFNILGMSNIEEIFLGYCLFVLAIIGQYEIGHKHYHCPLIKADIQIIYVRDHFPNPRRRLLWRNTDQRNEGFGFFCTLVPSLHSFILVFGFGYFLYIELFHPYGRDSLQWMIYPLCSSPSTLLKL